MNRTGQWLRLLPTGVFALLFHVVACNASEDEAPPSRSGLKPDKALQNLTPDELSSFCAWTERYRRSCDAGISGSMTCAESLALLVDGCTATVSEFEVCVVDSSRADSICDPAAPLAKSCGFLRECLPIPE